MSKDALERLAATIRERRTETADKSYTRQLLDDPIKSAKKVGEEGVEVAIAATAQDRAALLSESADLLYHFLVLLESRDITFEEVCAVLEERMGTSGLARRKGPAG
ncbi:MAG: phosphoribosyl-ATP diphosphatase [Methyloceanibacter sp.]|nr:phosphoribosyl-ATP diphosphatase [Methyloceanibacter sp.]